MRRIPLDNQYYAHLIQQEFYQELFFGDDTHKSAIAIEVLRLYALLPSNFKHHFHETTNLIALAEYYSQKPPCKLSDIFSSLTKKGLIRTLDITAFISAEMKLTSYDVEKFDHYKALAMIVIMQLVFAGDHRAKITELCNEIRQYAAGKRDNVIPYLPVLIQESFPTLIEHLEDVTSDESIKKPIRSKIDSYKKSIRDSYKGKQGFHRKGSTREYKNNSTISTKPMANLSDDDDTYLIEIQQHEVVECEWEKEDNQLNQRSLSMVGSTKFIHRSPLLNAMQAKAINQHIRKREMNLTCDISRINLIDISYLVHHCHNSIVNIDDHHLCARILLMMLCSGNTVEEIKTWKPMYSKDRKSIIGVKRQFKIPSQKVREEIAFLLAPVDEYYVLPLPSFIVESLKNFRFKDVVVEDLKRYFQTIKKQHRLSLTFSMVSQYLSQTLKANQIDATIIDLLRGLEPQNTPARYYTYISYSRLLTSYERYLSYISNISKIPQFLDFEHIDSANALGSPLYISPNHIKKVLSSMSALLDRVTPTQADYFSPRYHNLRVIRLQILLGLSSGYRPVKGWFGVFDDIHFSTGEYRIAEKERDIGYHGRTVILPKIVLRELTLYNDYCSKATLFHSHNNLISERFNEAITSEQSFCFYLSANQVKECTPSQYSLHADKVLPLQPNWTRHYLRSLLFELDINGELIDAWLGHQRENQLPFEQFSSLNRKALLEITNLLDSHIQLLCGERDVETNR